MVLYSYATLGSILKYGVGSLYWLIPPYSPVPAQGLGPNLALLSAGGYKPFLPYTSLLTLIHTDGSLTPGPSSFKGSYKAL